MNDAENFNCLPGRSSHERQSASSAIEDEKFRLSVSPVARCLSSLLKDLEEAFYAIEGFGGIRPSMVFPDVTKLGLRYTFYEGMGFIEYGEFQQPCQGQGSQRSSLFTEVRSDKSLTNLRVEQDYSTSVLRGLGIQCELKTQLLNTSFREERRPFKDLTNFDMAEADDCREGYTRCSEGKLRASSLSVKASVAKITVGYFNVNGDGGLDQDRLCAIYDEEEGFTTIGKLAASSLNERTKEALIEHQLVEPEKF